MAKVEFIDLKSQEKIIGKNIRHAMKKVIAHGRFIMGPEVFELEKELSNYTGAAHAVSCSSGTDALLMALMAIDIRPKDLVFTTAFSFIAAAEVISLLGAVPVFVDVDPNTFNIDPDKLDEAISKSNKEKAKCIIPVDLFGLPADYSRINEIAKSHNLVVIEDAAQSFGASHKDAHACNLAHIGITSFFPAKPLGCYGDGGAVFTNDPEIAERLVSIRVHGKGNHKYDNVYQGINARLDTIQAAILLEKLKIFESELAQRRILAKRYQKNIAGELTCQVVPEGLKSAWALFSVCSKKRDIIMQVLYKEGIPAAIYYPKPLHLQTVFSKLGYSKGDFPVSESLSDTILSLPFHPYLTIETVDRISEIVTLLK
jgi:UDP-2-acetamido-2-deoxy-ribo-hexuluronate aminotransferase